MNSFVSTPVSGMEEPWGEQPPSTTPLQGPSEEQQQQQQQQQQQPEAAGAGIRGPSPHFQHIPQVQHLTWTDTFYDGNPGVIAVFDRDTNRVLSAFDTSNRLLVGYVVLMTLLILLYSLMLSDSDHFFIPWVLVFSVIWIGQKREKLPDLLHVAVTVEGVRLDKDGVIIMIPFEIIHSVDVKRYLPGWERGPPLSTVILHRKRIPNDNNNNTTSGCRSTTTVIETLHGIHRGQEFVDLVMALLPDDSHGDVPISLPPLV